MLCIIIPKNQFINSKIKINHKNHIVRYSNLKSDFIEQDQIQEESPFSKVFGGKLKEKNECKLCSESHYSQQEFMMLNFSPFDLTQKKYINNNRKVYFNLLEDEICSKRNRVFRSFEKFQVGLFDYIYHFLHKDEIEGNNPEEIYQQMQNFGFCQRSSQIEKNTFFCENCQIEINTSKKYQITELPHALSIGFSESQIENQLPFKLEETLNLSFFIKKDDRGRSILLTEEILKVNQKVKQNNKTKKEFNNYIYNIICFVIKRWDDELIINFKHKNKWYQQIKFQVQEIEFQQIDRTNKNGQIVFCIYEQNINHNQQEKNLIVKIKEQSQQENKVFIPFNFMNKFRYLNDKNFFSVDFQICQHSKLRPCYYDVYQKQYNQKTTFFNLPIEKIKDLEQQLDHIQPSYTLLNYLQQGEYVPEEVADFLLKEKFITKKNIDLKKLDYQSHCQRCYENMKNFSLKRLFQKILLINLLKKEQEKEFMIDLVWFKNYRLFLQADMKDNNFCKIFFNYEYVNEEINQDIESYYEQFKQVHDNDQLIAEKEFVCLNSSTFQFLEKIYGVETLVILRNNKIQFLEPQEKQNLMTELKLNYEEQFIMDQILKEVPIIEDIIVKQLFIMNDKINAYLNFKMETELLILKNNDIINCKNTLREKMQNFKKYFGDDFNNQKFDPCQEVFEIFAQYDTQLQGHRMTYVMDREKSNKMKNKKGYRKTAKSINLFTKVLTQKCLNEQEKKQSKNNILASIDQENKKKEIQEKSFRKEDTPFLFSKNLVNELDIAKDFNIDQNQQINNDDELDFELVKKNDINQQKQNFNKRTSKNSEISEITQRKSDFIDNELLSERKSIFEELDFQIKNIDLEKLQQDTCSQYTTSQMFSEQDQEQDQSNLLSSQIKENQQPKKKIIKSFLKNSQVNNQQKFSLFIKPEDYSKAFNSNSFSDDKDISSDLEDLTSEQQQKKNSQETIKTIKEENLIESQISEQDNNLADQLQDDIFDWIDQDFEEPDNQNRMSIYNCSLKIPIQDSSMKKSHFAQQNLEEEDYEQNLKSKSILTIPSANDDIFIRKEAQQQSKKYILELINRSEQIFERVQNLMKKKIPEKKEIKNKFMLLIQKSNETQDIVKKDSLLSQDITEDSFKQIENRQSEQVQRIHKKELIKQVSKSDVHQQIIMRDSIQPYNKKNDKNLKDLMKINMKNLFQKNLTKAQIEQEYENRKNSILIKQEKQYQENQKKGETLFQQRIQNPQIIQKNNFNYEIQLIKQAQIKSYKYIQ